jgi:hypothetical protein
MTAYKYQSFEDFMQAVINICNQNCLKKHNVSLGAYYKYHSFSKLSSISLSSDDIQKIWLDCLLPSMIYQVSMDFNVIYTKTPFITQDILSSAAAKLLSNIENTNFIEVNQEILTRYIFKQLFNSSFQKLKELFL